MEDLAKFQAVIDNYAENHQRYGYGVMSLEMPSDRRTIRYFELVKNFPFFSEVNERFSILDVGCGYGDIIGYLDCLGCSDYIYYGIDACDEFIKYDKEKYKHKDNVHFLLMDYYREKSIPFDFDYAVSSQTFNQPMTDGENNLELVQDIVGRTFDQCRIGCSFNFVTDRVQFKKQNVAYHSVEDIIRLAYSKTNSVVLDNSCMPFEATCTMLKDKATDGLVYDGFRKKHAEQFDNGTFVVINKE